MIKYRLSSNVTILSPLEYTYAETPLNYREEHFILTDEPSGKDFLINSTVRYFLEKFSSPKSEKEVLQEIATDVQAGVTEIKKACSPFIKFVKRKRIIVPEGEKEHRDSRKLLFQEGDQLDGMTITKVIANKRHLDLYLAVDNTSKTNLVVKLLHRSKSADDETYQEEFLELEREYSLLKTAVNIPYISQVFDFRSEKDIAYFTLEHINGKSLTRFLKETPNLNERDYNLIVENFLLAFSALHQAKLIHGDIHPSNLLVTDDKKVKIIDLGMALNTEMEKDEIVKIGGVNFYMPPERINIISIKKFSSGPDLFSDVYQIGLLIYVTYYKVSPFKAFTWKDLASAIKLGEISCPENSVPGFPVNPHIIKIIRRCLERNPTKRYKDATEILFDFQNIPR